MKRIRLWIIFGGLSLLLGAWNQQIPEGERQSAPGNHLQKPSDSLSCPEVNDVAPDFTLITSDGVPVKMSEFIKGKKLVLIDFWASWCGPCRQEGKKIKPIYEDFRDRGFDILGVSLDRNPEKWKQAIQDDNITWKQVSDLKGWTTPLCKQYNIRSIPFTILVDGEGRIVAKNLRSEELRQKIETIFNK